MNFKWDNDSSSNFYIADSFNRDASIAACTCSIDSISSYCSELSSSSAAAAIGQNVKSNDFRIATDKLYVGEREIVGEISSTYNKINANEENIIDIKLRVALLEEKIKKLLNSCAKGGYNGLGDYKLRSKLKTLNGRSVG